MSTYPERFEKFWHEYPRKVSKATAARSWEKQGIEDDMYLAQAAIDDIKKRTRMRWWSKDRTKIPHPATWINQRRWDDEDWEDEIGHAEGHQPVNTKYELPAQPEREWEWHEVMFSRLARSYMLISGGVPDADRMLTVRDNLVARDLPAFIEEIKSGTMERKDAALQLGKLFLDHLDAEFNFGFSRRAFQRALADRNQRGQSV